MPQERMRMHFEKKNLSPQIGFLTEGSSGKPCRTKIGYLNFEKHEKNPRGILMPTNSSGSARRAEDFELITKLFEEKGVRVVWVEPKDPALQAPHFKLYSGERLLKPCEANLIIGGINLELRYVHEGKKEELRKAAMQNGK